MDRERNFSRTDGTLIVMLSPVLHKNFLVVLIGDVALVSFSWIGAYLLRFNFEIPAESVGLMLRLLP